MPRKKPILTLLALSALCTLFAAGLHAQLIEPTRSLEGTRAEAGLLNVLSEPPGMEVKVDGNLIGKTPIFSARFSAGAHKLRIRDSETDIHLAAGKSLAISWFKGAFIEIPETVKRPAETTQQPPKPAATPQPEGPPGAQPGIPNDPYYWPLNPRGPIY